MTDPSPTVGPQKSQPPDLGDRQLTDAGGNAPVVGHAGFLSKDELRHACRVTGNCTPLNSLEPADLAYIVLDFARFPSRVSDLKKMMVSKSSTSFKVAKPRSATMAIRMSFGWRRRSQNNGSSSWSFRWPSARTSSTSSTGAALIATGRLHACDEQGVIASVARRPVQFDAGLRAVVHPHVAPRRTQRVEVDASVAQMLVHLLHRAAVQSGAGRRQPRPHRVNRQRRSVLRAQGAMGQ